MGLLKNSRTMKLWNSEQLLNKPRKAPENQLEPDYNQFIPNYIGSSALITCYLRGSRTHIKPHVLQISFITRSKTGFWNTTKICEILKSGKNFAGEVKSKLIFSGEKGSQKHFPNPQQPKKSKPNTCIN